MADYREKIDKVEAEQYTGPNSVAVGDRSILNSPDWVCWRLKGDVLRPFAVCGLGALYPLHQNDWVVTSKWDATRRVECDGEFRRLYEVDPCPASPPSTPSPAS